MRGTRVAFPGNVTSQLSAVMGVLLCLGGACGRIGSGLPPGADSCTDLACRPTTTASWTANRGPWPLDLLIVLDDSVPSSPAGAALAGALQAVAANLQAQLDVTRYSADIHVAVVPANVADPASATRLWPTSSGCPEPDGAFLRTSLLCDAPANFSAPLADVLGCAATSLLPSGQPSRPLETVRALLAPGGPAESTGFRRPTRVLSLTIVTATDDAALATEAARTEYHDYLVQRVPDPRSIEVFVVGPANATGLRELSKKFDQPEIDDVASESWPLLSWVGEPAKIDSLTFCIYQPYAEDGLQATIGRLDCRVSERATALDGSSTETRVPACPADATSTGALEAPCWRAVVDTNRCPVSGLLLRIDAPPTGCRSSNRITYQATCAVSYAPAVPNDLGNRPPGCGTENEPTPLTVVNRSPALGATVKNSDIVESFTVKAPFFVLDPLVVESTSPAHTAGGVYGGANGWGLIGSGRDVRFERTVASWTSAPGHVELAAVVGWKTDDGCYYKLPSPLLSYDVTP